MLHYGMGLGEALGTRLGQAKYLVSRAERREEDWLVSLTAAFHAPKHVLDEVEKAREGRGREAAKEAPAEFSAGLARLARLRPGSAAENERLAQDIMLRGRAAELLARAKKPKGDKGA